MGSKVLAIILTLIIIFTSISGVCTASEVTIKSIDPSPYYDSRPNIWGNYIVWRRAINQNGNAVIELSEPSWIMVHNIKSGKSWSITPVNKVISGNIYEHAESPDIWNGKIIYEAQVDTNSYNTHLFMHNISGNDTWQIPIRSTDYAHGHLHAIYGEWMVYTNIADGNRQAYMYNYKDGIYRTIIGRSESNTTYGLAMNDKHVALTVRDKNRNYNVWVYDITLTGTKRLNYSSNYSMMIATSIYGGEIGLSILEEVGNSTQWNVYRYNIANGNYVKVHDNTHGLLLWETQMAYQYDGNIHMIDIDGLTIIPTSHTQYIGDIYKNTLVWMDNQNSDMLYGDARDNFDIYVRAVVTDKEIIIDNLVIIVIIVAVVVVALIFRGNKLDGMV